MVTSQKLRRNLALDVPRFTGKWKSMDSADKVKSYVNLLDRKGSDKAVSRTTRKQSLASSTAARIQKILRPKIALRVVGICILGCLTGFLVFNSPYWMAAIWTGLGTAALFYETVR